MLARDQPFSANEARHQAKQALIDLGRRAVPALIEALREGPKSIRDDCIELLTQIRPVDEPTIEAIIAATKEPGTRFGVDEALKKLAMQSPRAIEALLAEARNEDPARREDAALALGGPGTDEYVRAVEPVLLRLLTDDTNEDVRAVASLGISRLGPPIQGISLVRPPSEPVLTALIDRARKDPSAKVRSRALDGIARAIKTHPDARAVILAALMDPSPDVVSAALFHLEDRVGSKDQTTIAALLAVLRERPEAEIRARASEVIASADGEPSPVLVQEMTRYLHDPSPRDRDSALSVLSEGKTLPDEAVSPLIEILDRGERDQRAEAADLLSRVRPVPDPVLRVLTAALDDDDRVAAAAGRTLSKIGAAAVPHLTAALVGAPQYRQHVIQRALQEMGAEAVPALLIALENKDPAVRAGLREALRRMQDDAVARLTDALLTARPALQREILQVLEQKSFRLPRKPENLARYRAMLRSPDSEVREAAASLLGALGGADPAAVQGLVSALAGDSTLTVRVAAARCWGG